MMEGKNSQNRQYFTLVEKTGSWNHYQFYLFVIFSFVSMFDSALMFSPPFLFYISAYQCDGFATDSCTSFVCSLDVSERGQYMPDAPFHSLAQDFDLDFQCQDVNTITLFSTLVFVGSIGGMLVFSTFTEKVGRKVALSLSITILIFGLILILLSGYFKSIPLVIVGMILTYCGCQNGYQYVFCYSAQVVAEEWRVTFLNTLNGIYGLGIILVAFAFYYLKQWTYVYLFFFLIPAILTLLAIYFIIEKTPLDMLANYNEDLIMQRLRKLSDMNKVQFTITIQEVRHLKQDYLNSINRASHQSFTVIDLFSYKSLRNIMIPLIFVNFSVNYLYYSPSAVKSSISNDIFKQNVVQGFSNFISSILVHYYFEKIERRNSNLILVVTTLLSLWLLLIEEDNKSSSQYTVIYLTYRTCLTLSIFVVSMMNYQSFPAQIRAVGSTFVYLIGNISGLLQPVITSTWKSHGWNILYSFIGVCLFAFIPNFFLKETSKVSPPEIIEELENTNTYQAQPPELS